MNAIDCIVDAHAHLGCSKEFYYPDISIESVLGIMDNLHIDKMLQTHTLLFYDEYDKGISESVKAFEKSHGRILSYLIFNPRKSEESLKIINDNINKQPFVGIKIHPSFHLYPADGEDYDIIWEYASKNNVVLLTHSWAISPVNPNQIYSQVKLFERYLKKYPDVKLILGHSGGLEQGIRKAVELARIYPNVYLDISGDILFFGLIEFLVENAGADKVLFGSDLTMLDPRINLSRVLMAKIDLETKRKILGLNACRLFGQKIICNRRLT
jgi:predicted TIM-barrel fold metal-dependent hydrolase